MTNFSKSQILTIVKHLASGKDADTVADIMSTSYTAVMEIAKHHGYPDVDKLAWAADVLEKKLDDDNQPTASTLPAGTPVLAERPGTTPVKPSPLPPVVGTPDTVGALIAKAQTHPSKKVQAQAQRALDVVGRLRQLIVEDEQKNHEKRKAAAEKIKAKAEVERLKAELAAAQAKLRGPAKPKPTSTAPAPGLDQGPTAAAIRAWAAENGIQCPATGRVPATVRATYDAHHLEEAS